MIGKTRMARMTTEPGNKAEPDNKVGLQGMTDDQLQTGYEQSLEHVEFSDKDYSREIERRVKVKHGAAIRRLTWFITFLTVVTTIIAILTLYSTFGVG